MQKSILLPAHNLYVVNFAKIYKTKFTEDFLKSVETYNIKNVTLKNKDVRKLFVHHLIHSLCEEIIESRHKEKLVIFFGTNALPMTMINQYFNEEELLFYIEKTFKQIIKLLPIKIYITSNSFDYFVYLVQQQKAETVELLNTIKAFVADDRLIKFTFEKAKNYTKKYGLTFLSNIYFNNIKSKLLLIKG
jgi:hypothetical protein